MHTTHKLNLTRARVAVISAAIFALAALAFAVAPMQRVAAARQAVAQRISQSETAVKLISLAPAPVRDAVGARLGVYRAVNVAAGNLAAAMSGNTDVQLTMSVSVNAAGNAGGSNVIAGRAVIDYDVTVTNNGPNDILAGEVTVQIPGLSTILTDSNLEVVPTGGFAGFGACTPAGLVAGCSNSATISNGNTSTLSFSINVGSHNQAGKTITVNPSVVANAPLVDTTPGNNAPSDTRTVANSGVLNLRKQATIVSYPGGFITYTLLAQATGSGWTPGDAGSPGAAFNSSMFENRVVDTMPVEIGEIISITPGTGWSCTPPPGLVNPPATTVQCDQNANVGFYPNAAYATVATIVVKTKLNLQDGQTVTNIASISEDPTPAGIVSSAIDSDTATTLIRVAADLSINKTATTVAGGTGPQVTAGGTSFTAPTPVGTGDIAYDLTVANAGPGDAENVVILDNIPANLNGTDFPTLDTTTVFINGVAQPTFNLTCGFVSGQIGCVPGNNTAINPNFVAGVLPNKFVGVIRYRARVPANVAAGTVIQNQASVNSSAPGDPTAQTPDPNAGNNVSLPTQVLVTASADLGITKATSNATPVSGSAYAYTLIVTNNGPSDAKDVVVTDPLPQSVRFLSFSLPAGSGFSCTAPAQNTVGTVTCTNPSLANGASVAIGITVEIDPNVAAGVRTNTASVVTSTNDSVTGNNSASAQIDIFTDADLTITKTGTPTSVVAGNNITYTINVNNVGISKAFNVALTDTFPANTTFVSLNGTGILAGCSGGTSLSCPTSDMDVGTSASLTIVLRVNPGAAAGVGALSNTANLAWSADSDADADTASSTFTSDVTRSTDLSIEKDDSPDAVTAGQDIIYSIKVKNNGPSTAATGAVTVTDATPTNTTDVSVSGTGVFSGCNTPAALHAGCTNAGGAMQPGEEAVITYRVTVNANTPVGFITNIASVTAAEDGNNTNNQATRQTAVGPNADLQLTKTASPASVIAGEATSIITYTITYRNSGPSDAQSVVVSDTVAANLIPVGTITAAGMTCDGATATAGAQFTCSPTAGSGVLTPGSSGTITYQVRVPANVPAGALITNQANIASTGATATPDPNTSNNTQAPTSTLVIANADLSIVKTDSPDPVVAGQTVTYTLAVSNAGPSDAQSVVVTDALPATLTYVSVAATPAPPAWSCTNTNNTVTCNKPTLAAGASETITIVARVNANVAANTLISNTATIASNTTEVGAGANSSTANTSVGTNADVVITKYDQPDYVIAGANLTYNLTVTNNGPSDAVDLRLSDPLPANVSFVSFSGTGIFSVAGACIQTGNTVSCGQPGGPSLTLPAGASANLTIVGKVASSVPAGTLLANTATTTWQDSNGAATTTSLNTTNITVNTTVRHQSDLSLKKEAPEDVVAGTRMDYTLTIKNLGLSDVLGGVNPGTVTVEDTLPTGVMAIEPMTPPNTIISGPGGFTCSYNMGTNRVTCVNAAGTPGDVPAGSIITIVFKVKTDPGLDDGENLNNCAQITAPIVTSDPTAAAETDPNGGNNQSCDSTVVRTLADLGIYKSAAPLTAVPGSNPPAVRAGENIVYTLEFGNAGPSNAQNVRITDLIPGNTSYVTPAVPFTILATGGVYTGANSVNIVCDRVPAGSNDLVCVPRNNAGLTPALVDGELPAAVQGVITYQVKVNESVTGGSIIANAAKITSADGGTQPSTADPNPGNNTSLTTSTPVIAASQLVVTKAVVASTAAVDPGAAVGAVIPGTSLTYEITIRNNGPSDVSNLRVIDTLPGAMDSVGRVTGVKYVSVTQTAGFGTTFTCAPPTGVNPTNNPNGNGGTLQCTAPLMSANAPNNEARIQIVVFIDPATKNALVNTVNANATINNFNQPTSATFTLTTPVSPTSNLAVTKTHTPDPVIAGTEFDYTVTLTNNGQSTAQMASLVDTLPPYQTIVSTQITQTPDINGAPAFTCTPTTIPGPPAYQVLTCTAAELPPNKRQDGTVNPSGTVTFKIRVKQSSLTPQPTPTSYQNCVTATSMSYDPVTANSTNVCDTVNVIFRADVFGAKVDTPDPVIAGTNLTYTITASNRGPSAALNFRISDPLPTGTVFVSAAASPGATLITPAVNANGVVTATWDAAGGTTIGLTDVGVVRTLTIVVRVCPDYQQIHNLTDAQMCVPNLTNTAAVSSLTPEEAATLTDNAPSATTTVQAQSDLAISKSGPAEAIYSTTGNLSNITYTLTFSNSGPSNSSGTMIVDVLPKGFTVVGTPTSTVPGTTFTVTTVDGVSTVRANLGVLGAANQCSLTRPTSGTVTIVANIPIKHPTITVTNVATISTTNCLADPNLANNTATWDTRIVPPPFNPGRAFPALAEAADTKEGSILFYPVYTSDAANGNTQNTRISLTNTSPTESVVVHLFAVDGSSCSVLDAFLCLTPNQTSTFLASDFDPGATGYLVAVAVDSDNGLPRAFNELIGDEFVKFSSGHQANLGAVAVAASMMFPAGVNPNVTSTTLRFDGMNYNRLPRVLALDNIFSPVDGNSTMLIVNRIGGNFTTTGASIGNISGLLYDDAEASFSFTTNPGSCQFRSILSNTFPRTFTPFNRVIPAGRTGWMKFWTVEDRGLLGSAINYNQAASASSSAFNQGHNLHHLTLTDAVTITVPVFIPSC